MHRILTLFLLAPVFMWMDLAAPAAAVNKGAPMPGEPLPDSSRILNSLHRGHPRLLLHADDFARLKTGTATDPVLSRWYPKLANRGRKMLDEPPCRYEIPDGKRLLATSRRVVERVTTLAMLYRLDGDRRWADRAWTELAAAAAFKDWNPPHFLDTSEMTAAFAFGYDWLYDAWTDEQRALLRNAIVSHGLKPGFAAYHQTPRPSFGWWTDAQHNWNQVCNGGLILGALAVADEEPQLAGTLVHDAVESLPLAMRHFAPDGAWAEGPGYWAYAVTYNVFAVAGLDSALGTDFGLSRIPGFDQAGFFPVYLTGATGLPFEFADCHPYTKPYINEPALFWLARRFGQPAFAQYQLKAASGSPFDFAWYDPKTAAAPVPELPLAKHFRTADVVVFRSGWQDPDGGFAGFKAGDNKVNHSHLDLGDFEFDALGRRWIIDLGADDYNLPGFFGKERWTYYRQRAEGHNTLVLGNMERRDLADQDPAAAAPVIRFSGTGPAPRAVADLTAAYAHAATRVRRGLALAGRSGLVIRDEVVRRTPGDVWSFLHTRAAVQVAADGRSAELTLDGRHLTAYLLQPAEARWTVMDAVPLPDSPHPPRQAANEGVRKLAVHLSGVTAATLVIHLVPHADGAPAAPAPALASQPLDAW